MVKALNANPNFYFNFLPIRILLIYVRKFYQEKCALPQKSIGAVTTNKNKKTIIPIHVSNSIARTGQPEQATEQKVKAKNFQQ